VALFETTNGVTQFRGLPVTIHRICIAGRIFEIAALEDAAALLDDDVFVRECEKTDRLPYGFELWPSALMLAEHLCKSESGNERHAIELGCGVGLVSLVAAKMGWRVVVTDCDHVALQFAEYNAAANEVKVEAFRIFDWHHPCDNARYSLILAADVLYQRSDHEAVMDCIARILANDGSAIIADPSRGVADAFPLMAQKKGFNVEIAPASAKLNHHPLVTGRLFILRPTRNLP